jgi:hypothetical protein
MVRNQGVLVHLGLDNWADGAKGHGQRLRGGKLGLWEGVGMMRHEYMFDYCNGLSLIMVGLGWLRIFWILEHLDI